MAGNRGPWTNIEKEFVATNCDTLTPEEIGRQLSRDPQTIKRYIRDKLGRNIRDKNRVRPVVLTQGTDIQRSIIWRELQKEFSEQELDLFIFHWNRIVTQFKEDIFPTEELQIVDMIKLEILMSRALKMQQETMKEIETGKQKAIELESLPHSIDKEQKLMNLQNQYNYTKAAYEALNKEFHSLLQRKESMLRELKATRKDRIKKIEDSKETFTGWITELMNNSKLRRELGLYIEKMRIAIKVEEARIFTPHTYLDGQQDLPLLTAESVEKLEQESNKND